MPMYACQLWSKYTLAGMKHLHAAYNNAYRIMHYILRNISVRPHQVSHMLRLLMPYLEIICITSYIVHLPSSNFFIRSL